MASRAPVLLVLAHVLALAACTGDAARPDEAHGPAAADAAGPDATSSAASAAAQTDAPQTDAECADCHVAIAREWRASAHRDAFTGDVFQAEWAPLRQTSCVTCHAPLADPHAPEGDGATDGVSCVTCHLRDGAIVAPRVSGRAPHEVRVEPSLGTETACAPCHDFTFARIMPTAFPAGDAVQATLHEFARSPERGVCQRCHMPEVGEGGARHHAHGFPGARDPSLLARALDVRATARRGPRGTTLELELRVAGAAHDVPTGDMFRRLEVHAWPAGRARAERVLTLGRVLGHEHGLRRIVRDERVPVDGVRRVTIALPRTSRVAWRIDWLALEPELAAQRWIPEDELRRVAAEGTVDAP